MIDKLKDSWKEILMLFGSTIGLCIGVNTFLLLEAADNIRDEIHRENDVITTRIEDLHRRMDTLSDRMETQK